MTTKYKKYEKYKDSGTKWIGEIPEHWKVKKLKFITNKIIDGTHFTPEYLDKGIPFLRVTDITQSKNGKIDWDNVKFISKEEHEFLSVRCKPEKGDLLLSKNGTIGVPKVVDFDKEFSIFVSLCLLKFKKYNSYFASYFFLSDSIKEQIYYGGKSNTITNLHLDKIKEFYFVSPNLEEQKIIAEYLDKKTSLIEQIISKKQKQIELLKEKRSSLINHAVTKGLNPNVKMKDSGIEWIGEIPEHWEVTKLKYISNIIRGAILRPVDEPSYFDEKGLWYYLNISDVTASETRYITKAKLKLSELGSTKSQRVLPNNIILTASATIGKPFITKVNLCIHDGFIAFSNFKVNINFLYWYLNNGNLYKNIGKSNTQKNLYLDEVKDIFFSFPTSDDQKIIAEYLDNKTSKIDSLIQKIEQQIELLKEKKTVLISNAVTGKIDVINGSL